jgi:predicted PurR-regulated permease PerM
MSITRLPLPRKQTASTVPPLTFPTPAARNPAGTVVSACCLLAILYFGQPVLMPLTLAAILSLMLAPPLRTLGRLGMRRLPAVLGVLLLAGAGVGGTGMLLSAQLLDVSAELPAYRTTIGNKIRELQQFGERSLARFSTAFGMAPAEHAATSPSAAQPRAAATDSLTRVLARMWGPIGEAGLVLLLLLFILLEHESLQDRLIRLAGDAEMSRTVRALADAAHGVSRFFFCQMLVNTGFGIAVGLGLWAAGRPHALLWGTLSAFLRFVPFVGALAAGSLIGVFAAATVPGWNLALACLVLFVVLELLVAHWIEPRLSAHSTGLSPLAVVVSALCWGTLWGAPGLLVATPLTVCMMVAARHVRGLAPLAVLLGQAPDVTGAQRFFLRALAGDSKAITQDAQAILQRATFARYCDQVLLPGLALAASELQLGLIDSAQQSEMRYTIAEVAETLAPAGAPPARRRRRQPLLDASVGAHLRHRREARLGRWQGSLDVPVGSIDLCAGLPSERDDLLAELLARALREAGMDARSVSLPLPHQEHTPDKASLVRTLFLPLPAADMLGEWRHAAADVRALLPQAWLVALHMPGDPPAPPEVVAVVDMVLHTFEEAVSFAAHQHGTAMPSAPLN